MPRNLLLRAAFGALSVLAMPAFAAPSPWTPPAHAEIVVVERELAVDPIKIGGLGAIASGAVLIESAVRATSEANGKGRAGPLRRELAGFDFGARFEQALRARLAQEGLSIQVERLVAERDPDAKPPGVPARALVMKPRYAMDAGFESLWMTVDVRDLDRTLRGVGRLKQSLGKNSPYADNRTAYGVRFRMPRVAGSGASEDAARWVALGGPELTAMLDAGLAELATMIVHDLTPAGRADRDDGKQLGFVQFDGEPMRGRMVQVGDHRWLRDRVGLQAAHRLDAAARPYSAASPAAPAPAVSGTPTQDAADTQGQ